MASSRIFIKGLPPTISEDEFKKHFTLKQEITDAKLIPQRRIGYIGYKTPEDAAKAVKYFNRTFIRMSKIGVEIARPVSDATLPISRKAKREQQREYEKTKKAKEAADTDSKPALPLGSKRKWSDLEQSDPKLQEFLEIYQSKSKPRGIQDSDAFAEPPKKMQAIEIPAGESDDEYEEVPKKSKKASPPPNSQYLPTITPISQPLEPENMPISEETAPVVATNDTDEDWLRGRTNRLLDLMDPDDIVMGSAAPIQTTSEPTVEVIAAQAPEPDIQKEPASEVAPLDLDEDNTDAVIEAIQKNGRLFVRNLPYGASEDDLRKHFEPYGTLEELHLPIDSKGKSKGFVLVQYAEPSAAADAYHNIDGEHFQGRLLHVIPAANKRENKLDEFAIAKLPLKKQKQIKKKAEASSSIFNWNSLYMNQDAVNSAIADRLGVSKSELLDPTSADAGVKQAIAETSVIQESKAYFTSNGVDLDAFKSRERGETAILVKNFHHGMSLEELRRLFEEFGQVLRVLMPPTGTIAIVEFAQPSHARAAFASLAYRRIQDSVLFLEKAPKDLFTGQPPQATAVPAGSSAAAGPQILSASDLLERESNADLSNATTLFVRNLNFVTTTDKLTEVFSPLDGFLSARVNTKLDPKKPGQILSMGFGFLEFRTKAQAQAALKTMDGYSLDSHKLLIKASHRGLDAAEERRKEDKAKKADGQRTKIVVKNLPFEASKKDVRTLLGAYGQLRSVRLPMKFDRSARGFAFADFITAREAENALEALKDTHLLGRRLVLEFAADDPVDAEEEIAKMQKKIGSQVNKVALQQLTGRDRKKFNIEGNDGDED